MKQQSIGSIVFGPPITTNIPEIKNQDAFIQTVDSLKNYIISKSEFPTISGVNGSISSQFVKDLANIKAKLMENRPNDKFEDFDTLFNNLMIKYKI